MKNLKFFHFLIVYPSLWIIYCLFEFVAGKISDMYSIFMNLIPAVLLGIISYVFFIFHKRSSILKWNTTLFFISLLFVSDQLSKIIISIFFKSTGLSSINIIPGYFSFTPHINSHGSFIASRFDINAPFILFTILNFLILLLIFSVYKFKMFKNQINPTSQLAFIFLFSGGLCSLIDKIFWGGSLDFLHIHNLFIADIKDILITFGLGSFILSSMTSDEQSELKDFLNFIFMKRK